MLTKDVLNRAITNIVQHQILVIGPLAVEQANKVSGMRVTSNKPVNITLNSTDSAKILTELVENYEKLFGTASVAVCKDAIKEIHPPIPDEELPEILR